MKNNEIPFQETTSQAGLKSRFVCGDANRIADFPENYFDLILNSFLIGSITPSISNNPLSAVARLVR